MICRLNLELLQVPLSMIIPASELDSVLANFEEDYQSYYQILMLQKLGLSTAEIPNDQDLLQKTIELLQESQVGYHQFFTELTENFNLGWREDPTKILENTDLGKADWTSWKVLYHLVLMSLPKDEFIQVGDRLKSANPKTALLRPLIEEVWDAIADNDDWRSFEELVQRLQTKN